MIFITKFPIEISFSGGLFSGAFAVSFREGNIGLTRLDMSWVVPPPRMTVANEGLSGSLLYIILLVTVGRGTTQDMSRKMCFWKTFFPGKFDLWKLRTQKSVSFFRITPKPLRSRLIMNCLSVAANGLQQKNEWNSKCKLYMQIACKQQNNWENRDLRNQN